MYFLKADKERKFYIIAGLFVLTGWLWFLLPASGYNGAGVCIFRHVTGQPCPACGSTASLLLLLEGDWKGSFVTNPLAYVLAPGLFLLPVWLAYDLLSRKNSIYRSMFAFDARIRRQPLLLIPVLLPVILIWIWNIIKL